MTTTAADPESSTGPAGAFPRRWLGFTVLMAAAFMDLLDVTVVNVALPTLRTGLGASYAAAQWIMGGYLLAFGLGLITGGRLGDRYGRRRVFVTGVLAFTVASLLCGLAPGPEVLIFARILQGVAAALMIPQIMATVFTTFPVSERGRVIGLYSAIAGVATVLGPVVAGLLISYDVAGLGWRAIFLVNVPVGVAAVFAAAAFVPETRSENPLRMDLLGVLLVTVALVLVLYPLVQGNDSGWPEWMLWCLAASPVVLLLYALHARAKQRRDGSPLVPLKVFAAPGFAVGTLVVLLFDLVLIGFGLSITLTVQLGLGFNPVQGGLIYVPWAAGASLAAGLMDKLVARLGRHLVSIGSLLIVAGIAWTGIVASAGVGPFTLWPPMFVAGLGLGFVIGPSATLASAGVRPADAGAASGTLNAAGQIGSAAGAAVLGVLFFNILTGATGAAVDGRTHELGTELTAAGVPITQLADTVNKTKACVTDRLAADDAAEVPLSCRELPPDAALEAVGDRVTAEVRAETFLSGLRVACAALAAVMLLVGLLAQALPARED